VRRIAEPGQDVRNNPVRLWRQLRATVALLGEMKRECDALFSSAQPSLVIADFTVPVAGISAAQHGLPWWTTLPSPCVFETPDGPPAYVGGALPPTTLLGHSRQALLRRATRGFKRTMWALCRRELRAIGFSSVYRRDGSEAVYSPHRILALGLPELEFPRTYPPHFQFVGPVLFTPPYDGPSPDFSADGRPHVLVSLGTHLAHVKRNLAETVHRIAGRMPGVVFHFSHGSPVAGDLRQTANCREYAYVSYAEHLSRYDLVIHHAGAGIMNHCLRHGIPSVVYPVDYDQFDNAARLTVAGVALRARRSSHLETVLVRALRDPAIRAKCAEMRLALCRHDAEGTIAGLCAGL
jgi:UDP:flavonoid glycosyltransferase YjiC (YdhE family)